MKQLLSVLFLAFTVFLSKAQDVRTFKSVDDMRALPAVDTDSTFLYFISSRNDIDAFRYDPTDNTSTDDSVMVIVTSSGKRLKRNLTGVLYPDWWGARGDGVTDDTDAFNKMFSWLERKAMGGYIVYFKQKNYLLEDTVFLPMRITPTNNKATFLNIQAYGVHFTKNSGGPMFYRIPKTDTESGRAMNSYKLKFAGGNMQCNSSQTSTAIKLAAFYSSIIEDCNITGFDSAMVLPFWISGKIRNNAISNGSVGIKGTSGYDYWGIAPSQSAFNMNQVTGNRIRNNLTSYAGVMFYVADGLILENHISEGSFKPRYDIYFNYGSENVITGATFKNLWFENRPPSSGAPTRNTVMYISGAGNIEVNGFQNPYPDTLFEFGKCVNLTLNVSNIQWLVLPTDLKLFNVTGNATGQINVNNAPHGFANIFLDKDRWVGGNNPFPTVSTTVTGIRTSSSFTIDPLVHAAEGSTLNKSINITGGINFTTDNLSIIGQKSIGNARPKQIYVGDGGVVVSNTGGYFFGASGFSTTLAQSWRYVNDSVTRFNSTGSIRIPIGTTAQRPANFGGGFRYNSSLLRPEFNNGSAWLPVADTAWVLTKTNQTVTETIATNTAINVGAGRMITVLLVKPSAALADFKLGLTSGGDELVPTQALPAGVWKAFTLNQFFESAASIYFGGISTSTDIKLVQMIIN